MHIKSWIAKVIHRHFDETVSGRNSLFSKIFDRIILSEVQGKETVTDGWKLRKKYV